MSQRSTRSVGLTLLGYFFILISFHQMYRLIVEIPWYTMIFGGWPTWLIVLRYSFSWLQRIVGTILGIGLLTQKNIARQGTIAFAAFHILTLYWKHPYAAFKLHAQFMDRQYGSLFASAGAPWLSFEKLLPVSMTAQFINDILFWSLVIYFLTRPPVKEQFQ